MKKLIFALPILFLAVNSNIAYGEDICSKRDFTCQRHWAVMESVRPVVYQEDNKLSTFKSPFVTSDSRFANLKEWRPRWSMEIFGREFSLVITDDPGRIALQLQRSFN